MDLHVVIDKYLKGFTPSALFIDIDGVITLARGIYIIDLDLVNLLRELVATGIPVYIVSGNAYPVVLTLQRYLGFPPTFVAENGCIIQIDKEVVNLCNESLDPLVIKISREFNLRPSSSNIYRLCDRAFHIPNELRNNISAIRKLEKEIMNSYPEIYALYTGYVLHIYPRNCSKSTGIKIIAEKLGLDLSRAIAVGDSVTDIDMIKAVGVGVATGDADEELKKEALIVLPFKASESTKVFARTLLNYVKNLRDKEK
ncbi:MAG: phosphoglycolate phosphatase [Ignisphaera sp.]|uniref:Phosphoglycolate phosphatase n=1 Tax=Ignisphaera aggregans TaxID=334771 RepID=A0A7C4NLU3_9CREN